MSEFNYKLIEVARNSRGLSQKDLAALLPKLNQANISKVERGELTPIKEDILKIAEVLDFPESFFYGEETKMPISFIYYRKRATLPKKVLNKILAETHQIILRAIDRLLEEIDLKEYPRYIFDITDGWTTDAIANRLREILQIHPGRPVKDIVRLIEETGIIVFFYDCPNSKFDGLTSYTNNGIPVIIVNKNNSSERIKYTIVHEVIHLVAHIPCNVEPWRDYEDESNKATAEFYMPAKDCYKDLQNLSYYKLGSLKSYWGVSKAVIIRRAKDLNCINKETYTYLNIELGRKGERVKETGFVEIDEPQIIRTAIGLLKDQLGYTDEELAEKTCLSISDYSRFFNTTIAPHQIKLRVLKQGA